MSIDGSVHRRFLTQGRTLAKLVGLGMALMALPGCQSITGNPSLADLRIVDASPDAGALDFYEGDAVLAYNVGSGTASSYTQIAPGTYAVSADVSGSRQQLISAPGTFLANAQYTVLVGNYAANLQETILKDQSQPAPSGQIAVRFLDESNKTGGLDLYLVPSGSTLASTLAVAVNLTGQGNTGYIDVPVGTYTLVALKTGTVPSSTVSALYTGSAVTTPAGAARTVVLIDAPTTTTPGLQAMLLNDYDSPSE